MAVAKLFVFNANAKDFTDLKKKPLEQLFKTLKHQYIRTILKHFNTNKCFTFCVFQQNEMITFSHF